MKVPKSSERPLAFRI